MSCMIDSRCVAFTYTNQTCTNLETMSLEEAADAEIKWGSYYKKMGEELIPFQRIATDLITNIVASGPVFMSNVAKFGPWNLFDGKKTEEECEKALSGENEDMLHTNSLDEPYVLITLSLRQTIEGVKIWNRSYGGYHRRTADLEIRVSDDSSAMNTTESFCAYHDGMVDIVSQTFRCEKPVAGIYVRLQILVMNQVFNIYEVELLSHA